MKGIVRFETGTGRRGYTIALVLLLTACSSSVMPMSSTTPAPSTSIGGSNETDPVDQTTMIPLTPALRQNGAVIRYGGNGGDSDHDPAPAGDLVAQDPDTGGVRTLVDVRATAGGRVRWAAWSADGRWVAFDSLGCDGGSADEGGLGLWVTNGLDEPRSLTCDPDGDLLDGGIWEWSPTGAQLVVKRRSVGGDELVLIDPATGGQTDLGKTAGDITSLAWSPDGARIAYGVVPTGTSDSYSAAEQGSVYSVSVAGGDHSLLATSLGQVSGGENGSGIRWSPDGARMAVLTETEVAETRLYLMDADGSDLELLTEGVQIEHVMGSPGLMWSSDGTRMIYATTSGDRRGELQVWNGAPDGSTPILLFDSAPEEMGNSFSGGLVWSPDGAQVAFRFQNGWLVTNADGTGTIRDIDELQYLSWRGGWYFCECYG